MKLMETIRARLQTRRQTDEERYRALIDQAVSKDNLKAGDVDELMSLHDAVAPTGVTIEHVVAQLRASKQAEAIAVTLPERQAAVDQARATFKAFGAAEPEYKQKLQKMISEHEEERENVRVRLNAAQAALKEAVAASERAASIRSEIYFVTGSSTPAEVAEAKSLAKRTKTLGFIIHRDGEAAPDIAIEHCMRDGASYVQTLRHAEVVFAPYPGDPAEHFEQAKQIMDSIAPQRLTRFLLWGNEVAAVKRRLVRHEVVEVVEDLVERVAIGGRDQITKYTFVLHPGETPAHHQRKIDRLEEAAKKFDSSKVGTAVIQESRAIEDPFTQARRKENQPLRRAS